ncbi:MAG: MFS transporter [SAR324 cluster bacterium]|nr:MFS transporter [SAR324 cluster bacterium]
MSKRKKPVFLPAEKKSIFSLSAILFTRMLGLFLILPVFSLLAHEGLTGATPFLVGVAMGGYGLTSAIFQIPFGFWSDRFGRKPILVIGILLFMAGSVLAALSTSIEMMIVARLLQGSGAVSAPIFALIADLTRDEVRARANAMLGMGVGMAFGLAMFLGPFLGSKVGLSGLFWVISGMATFSLLVLLLIVPTPTEHVISKEPLKKQLSEVLKVTPLLTIDLGAFVTSMGLSITFFMTPFVLKSWGLPKEDWWQIYIPMLFSGALTMIPCAILAEVKNKFREVMVFGVVGMGISFSILLYSWGGDNLTLKLTAAFIFFMSFNIFEPIFPSLVTRMSTKETKGTASGVYNFSQFAGQFAGAILAGSYFYNPTPVLPIFMLVMIAFFLSRALAFENPTPRKKEVEEAEEVVVAGA